MKEVNSFQTQRWKWLQDHKLWQITDYCQFELVWIKLALGCWFFFGHFFKIHWNGFNHYYFLNFVGILLNNQQQWMLDSRPEAELLWRGRSQKAFGIIPPNAKGKSSFYWLILNVTCLCIIVDLRVGPLNCGQRPYELTLHRSHDVGTIKGLYSCTLLCEHAVELKEEYSLPRGRSKYIQFCEKAAKQIKHYCATKKAKCVAVYILGCVPLPLYILIQYECTVYVHCFDSCFKKWMTGNDTRWSPTHLN